MKTRAANSIRSMLALLLATTALVPLLLLGALITFGSFRGEIEQAKAMQRSLTRRTHDTISFYVHEQETALKALISTNDLLEMEATERKVLLAKFINSLKGPHHKDLYDQLAVLDEKGREVSRVSLKKVLTSADYRDRSGIEEFKAPLGNRQTYFGPLYFEQPSGEPFMKVSFPITDPRADRVKGVLVATLRMRFLWNVMADLQLCPECVAYVLDAEGRIVAHHNPSLVLQGGKVKLPGASQSGILQGLGGKSAFVASEPLSFGNQDFVVVTESPVLTALHHPLLNLLTISAFVLISMASTLLLGYLIVKKLIRPVEELAATARQISEGDLSQRASIRREDELGTLARAFNTMTDNLVETIGSLKREKDTLRAYIDTAEVIVVVVEEGGEVRLINRKGLSLLGYEEHEVLGNNWFEGFVAPRHRAAARADHSALAAGRAEGSTYLEAALVGKSGQERLVAWYNTELREKETGTPTPGAWLCTGVDITERRRAEDKVREQRDLIKDTIESLTHPFFLIDARDYTVKMANTACGFGPLTRASKCYKLTHKTETPCRGEDHPCTIREVVRQRKPVVLEHTHYDEKGNPAFFEIYGYPIFDSGGDISTVIEYNIDITARKRLEQQFLQAQKMEAVGRLAGGVAHDFNNLLTAIIGYSELLGLELPEESPFRPTVQIITEAGRKAAALTNQLLAFSRKQVLQMKTLSLDTVVADMLKIMKRVIGEDVEVEVRAGARQNIRADRAQIEQVLLNLAVNARDAMPGGGRITIHTSDVHLDRDYAEGHPGVTPGHYSMVAFMDSGHGMSREVQEKIFEPFFTTKGVRGTGLGLATVYGIVKQHGGHIYVYSEVGKGTTFRVYFPTTGEAEEEAAVQLRPEDYRGTERILVVDDEPYISKLVADTLQPLGYSVRQAATGKEALEALSSEAGGFDLLLTDVVMPGMSGQELGQRTSQQWPEIKTIYMSGYTDDEVSRHGMLQAGVNFLQKPVTPSQLLPKIREVLDRHRKL